MMDGDPFNARSGGHNVTKIEWIVELPGSDQPTGVCDVGHKEGTMLVCDRSKSTVVPVPRVRRSAANDQFGLEEAGLRSQGVVVDQI